MRTDPSNALLWYIVFLYSTTCHEAAHAWAALKLGDNTAFKGGQVSLNPWPHIRRSPLGMVVFPLLCWAAGGWMVGWASAPYSRDWARQFPRRAGLMAMAGPAANLILVAILAVVGFFKRLFGRRKRPFTDQTPTPPAPGSP